jgi:hypothetical protein
VSEAGGRVAAVVDDPRGRFSVPLAVQALVLDGARVLLARRRGSGDHDELRWADVDDLPDDTVDHVAGTGVVGR